MYYERPRLTFTLPCNRPCSLNKTLRIRSVVFFSAGVPSHFTVILWNIILQEITLLITANTLYS